MRYRAELIKSDEGYAICCPDLPGCWSQGKTQDEAMENIKDAISLYVETEAEMALLKEIRYVEVAVA